jgi:hypothetical protein
MKWMERCYLAVAAADLGFTFFGVGVTTPNGLHIVEANPVWTWVMEAGGKGVWAVLYLLQVAAILLLARRGGQVGRIVQMSVLGATAFSVVAWLFIVHSLF